MFAILSFLFLLSKSALIAARSAMACGVLLLLNCLVFKLSINVSVC